MKESKARYIKPTATTVKAQHIQQKATSVQKMRTTDRQHTEKPGAVFGEPNEMSDDVSGRIKRPEMWGFE